jgi:hypothetical protein
VAWWDLRSSNLGYRGGARWQEELRIDDIMTDKRIVEIGTMDAVRSVRDEWKPFRVSYRPQDRLGGIDGSNYYKPDLTMLVGRIWMFSARAVEVLRPLVEDDVEILPLICETDEVYAVNVVSAPRAVNLRKSKKNRLGAYVLNGLHVNRRKLHGYNMFRLYEWPFAIIVTDAVKEAIEGAELTGATCVKWLE